MGLLDNLIGAANGVLDALGAPDPERDEELRRERKQRERIKERKRAQYCKQTWSCPHCGWTNYGGECCNRCGNGNPSIPPNLW